MRKQLEKYIQTKFSFFSHNFLIFPPEKCWYTVLITYSHIMYYHKDKLHANLKALLFSFLDNALIRPTFDRNFDQKDHNIIIIIWISPIILKLSKDYIGVHIPKPWISIFASATWIDYRKLRCKYYNTNVSVIVADVILSKGSDYSENPPEFKTSQMKELPLLQTQTFQNHYR